MTFFHLFLNYEHPEDLWLCIIQFMSLCSFLCFTLIVIWWNLCIKLCKICIRVLVFSFGVWIVLGFFVTKADKILWEQFLSHKDFLLHNILQTSVLRAIIPISTKTEIK